LVTIAQTVFWVRLTTVIRRLPAGADDGCCAACCCDPAVGFRVFFADGLALALVLALEEAEAEADGEALRLGDADAAGEALAGPAP
jgi:hypothetical protein